MHIEADIYLNYYLKFHILSGARRPTVNSEVISAVTPVDTVTYTQKTAYVTNSERGCPSQAWTPLRQKKSPNQNPLLSGHLCCCLTTFPALRHMTPPHSHIHPMRACRTTEPLATVAVTSEDDTGYWRSLGQDIHITALLGEPGTLLGWGSGECGQNRRKTSELGWRQHRAI